MKGQARLWKILFVTLIVALFMDARISIKAPVAHVPRAYFVSESGDDKNEGTRDNPWKTIGRINEVHLKAGDSVLFEGEKVFEGNLEIDSNSRGAPSAPLLISSYGNGHAKINSGPISSVVLHLTRYLSVKNLDLTGAGRKTGNVKDGLSIIYCDHIKVDSLDITGFQKSGLFVFSSRNILVTNVNAHENGAAGIVIEGNQGKKESRNIQIRNCRVENNPGDPTNLTNHSGNGIVAGHCTNLLIEHCTATNNGWDMPRKGNGPVGIWCYESDSVIIQHCLSCRNKTSAGGNDGGGFDLDGGVTNSIIQYCLSYENQGSGYGIFQYDGASPWFNNIIRFNISENDGSVSEAKAGLYVWNGSGDLNQFYHCEVYNNTIYNSKEAAISFSEKSERKQFAFYNNIFVAGDSLIKGNKGKDIFLGNDWWSLKKKFNADGIQHFDEWAKKYNLEMISGKIAGFNLDPHFREPGKTILRDISQQKSFDHYRIPANSPLRNHGIDLHHQFGIQTEKRDFNQHPAPSKGIGASF